MTAARVATQTCSLCDSPAWARGWCGKHYARWRRFGTTDDRPRMSPRRRDRRALHDQWMRLVMVGDGCWAWRGYIDTEGYGVIHNRVMSNKAHRIGYEFLVGPIPEGLTLDHLCRNRACVRPDHLEPVTQAENNRRGISGDRMRARTHCPRMHPYNDQNTTIRKNGARQCRTCESARHRRRRSNLKGVMA